MSEFCMYEAEGIVFKLDKNGEKTRTIEERFRTRGTAKNDPYLHGSIMRQNPDLLRCDRMTVYTYQI